MATECSICLEKYEKQGDKIPKLLPCSHTVCLQCTGQLIQNSKLICPECRTENIVPAGGFPANRYLIENLDLAKKVEEKKDSANCLGEESRHKIVAHHEAIIAEILQEAQANILSRLETETAMVHGQVGNRVNVEGSKDGIVLNPRFLPDASVTTQANNTGQQGRERNNAEDENAQRARDAESGNEGHKCSCCCFCCCSSESEDNVVQDQSQGQSQCRRCCKVFLSVIKGIFMTFVYLISVVLLLAMCPIVVVFTIVISSLYFTAANVCIPLRSLDVNDVWKYFKNCKHRIERIFKKCRDLLYNWFNYYDQQCHCQGCKKWCHGFYLVILYFVLTIIFIIGIVGSLSLLIAGIAVILPIVFLGFCIICCCSNCNS